jgi:hypothetical protein
MIKENTSYALLNIQISKVLVAKEHFASVGRT